MRNLKAYVDQKNFWNQFAKRPLLDAANLTPAQIQDLFESIQCDLSPENLCCDGELRGAALKKKTAMINGAVRELRAEADRRGVDINECFWA